jgi:hypothetical protein
MAIQRKPDTRVHCVREDGMVAILVHDGAEDVSCWTVAETGDGAETVEETTTTTTATISTSTLETSQTTPSGFKIFETDLRDIPSGTRVVDVYLSDDGLKMFLLAHDAFTASDLHQYTLTTAFDLDTASKDGVSFSFASQSTQVFGVTFDPTGMRCYGIDGDNEIIYQYALSSAWDLSTMSYASKSYSVAATTTYPFGIAWKPDGTKFYVNDRDGQVFQYSATNWDISTGSYDSVSFDYTSEHTSGFSYSIRFNEDGTRFYIPTSNSLIFQYSLTAWDLSTAVYDNESVNTEVFATEFGIDVDLEGYTGAGFFMRKDETVYFQVPFSSDLVPDNVAQMSNGTTVTATSEVTVTEEEVSSTTTNYTTQNVEDVAVLPGGSGVSEDRVYYLVDREINGSTVRYIEKWALEEECQGGTINKCVDSHILGTITNGTMTGLSHLEGKEVKVWVNGKDIGKATVSGGQITGLSEDGSNACVGIAYIARWRSTKLGELTSLQKTARLGLILDNTHYQGVKYGPDFNNLDNLPLVEDGTALAADTVHTHYDERSFTLDGSWDSDTRVCLQGESPRPVTLLAAIVDLEG